MNDIEKKKFKDFLKDNLTIEMDYNYGDTPNIALYIDGEPFSKLSIGSINPYLTKN
jgi:hypothetical protein